MDYYSWPVTCWSGLKSQKCEVISEGVLVFHPLPEFWRSVNSWTTYYSYRVPKNCIWLLIFAWWVSSQDSTTELPTESTKSVKCDRQVWFLLNKRGKNCVQYCMYWLLKEYKYITVMSIYGRKGTKLNKCLCKARVCGVVMVTVFSLFRVVWGLYDETVSSDLFLQSLQGFSFLLFCVSCLTEFANQMQSTARLLHLILSGVICKMFEHLHSLLLWQHFKSAWQNWNKIKREKVKVCCSPLNSPSTSACSFFIKKTKQKKNIISFFQLRRLAFW